MGRERRFARGRRLMLILTMVVVFGFMAVEALRAARNERAQRAAGGIEPSDDVYGWIQIAYPTSFAAMFLEGFLRDDAPPRLALAAGVIVFALAKALKWWAILTLGRYWTFRVIVVPGTSLVRRGPYRFLRHPNYLGVIGELVGVGLLTGAFYVAPVATAVFGLLIARRVIVEERALKEAA